MPAAGTFVNSGGGKMVLARRSGRTWTGERVGGLIGGVRGKRLRNTLVAASAEIDTRNVSDASLLNNR